MKAGFTMNLNLQLHKAVPVWNGSADKRMSLYAVLNLVQSQMAVRFSDGSVHRHTHANGSRLWSSARPSPARWSAAEREQACNLFSALVETR